MTRQPYSTYLFILVVETVFIFIKESENVQCQLFFNNQFLYITYANDTTLFLSDKNPETEVIQIFEHFSISEKKVGNSRYWCSKRGPNSTLWYGMCKLKN